MNRSEAISFLKEYELYQEINTVISEVAEYIPGHREARGALQNLILDRLNQGYNNEKRKLVSAALKKLGVISVKSNGKYFYKNVRIKGA